VRCCSAFQEALDRDDLPYFLYRWAGIIMYVPFGEHSTKWRSGRVLHARVSRGGVKESLALGTSDHALPFWLKA
jgi:hypothetical protein